MANESNIGWVRLHRSMLEWEWFADPLTLQLWVVCLIKANHATTRVGGEMIARGSFATSIEALCAATGQSPRQVRTRLDRLQQSGEIEVRATNRKSMVTVCKYGYYQPEHFANDELPTNKTTNSKPGITGDESTKYDRVNFENDKQNDELTPAAAFSTAVRGGETPDSGDKLKTAVTNCISESCEHNIGVSDKQATSKTTNKTTNSKPGITGDESTKYDRVNFENDKQNDTQNDNKQEYIRSINNSLSSRTREATEAERESFFEIFFFKNFIDPENEVERFCSNYEASGWVRKNGQAVVDRIALAKGWTQEVKDAAPRFDTDFLKRYRLFYAAAKRRNEATAAVLIHDLTGVVISENRLTLVCSRRLMDILERNAAFFRANFLSKYYSGYALHYRAKRG